MRLFLCFLSFHSLAFVGISYFNNKNQPPVTPTATTASKESNQSETSGEATENSSQAVQGSSDHLLKLSAKERADEATEAFESWYKSFSNGDVILEINKELLKEGSGGTSPIELQTKSINQEVVSTFFQQAKNHLLSIKEVISNA